MDSNELRGRRRIKKVLSIKRRHQIWVHLVYGVDHRVQSKRVLWHGLRLNLCLAQHLPGGAGVIIGLPLGQGLIAAAASVVGVARLGKVGPTERERERESESVTKR